VGLKDKYRVIAMCGMADATTDPMEDARIAVSKTFTINGQTIGITAPYGHLREASDTIPSSQTFNLWHTVALLPKDVDASEIKRVSDIEKRGGRMVVQPAAGAFANPALGTGPLPPAATTPPASVPEKKDKGSTKQPS